MFFKLIFYCICECQLYKSWPQIEDMRENHEASLMEMETTHNDTLATLQEEHARTVKSKHLKPVALLYSLLQVKRNNNNMSYLVSDLKMAHEQQTKSLGEEFEKIRLSLQVNRFPSKYMLFTQTWSGTFCSS